MSKNQCPDEPHRPLPYTREKPYTNELCLKRFLPKRPELPKASAVAMRAATRVIFNVRKQQCSIQLYCCQICRQLPTNPVTGPCGHTWCMQCTTNARCQCGVSAPSDLRVNTLIRSLIEMLYRSGEKKTANTPYSYLRRRHPRCTRANPLTGISIAAKEKYINLSSKNRSLEAHSFSRVSERIIPLEPKARIELAGNLLRLGRFADAAPVLALIAVGGSQAKIARSILAKIITLESKGRVKRIPKITLDLYRAAVFPTVQTWFTPRDLECVLCFNTYTNPVTTQCGHTYCRGCILRHSKQCPLCRHPLSKLELTIINETSFINSALGVQGAERNSTRSIVPVLFLPTVAYPMVPCPIYISDPMYSRYLPMIKMVLEYGARRFGVASLNDDGSTANFGTIVEVRDCIFFQDGRCILSTIGVSRFEILEHSEAEGCDLVEIEAVIDRKPGYKLELVILYCRLVINTALTWLSKVDSDRINAIYHAYGKPPLEEYKSLPVEWNPDGPKLLWWFFSILPLGQGLKVLILSSRNMAHRAIAMRRALDVLTMNIDELV